MPLNLSKVKMLPSVHQVYTKCNEAGETIGITKEEANDLATFLKENTRKLKQAYDKGLFGGKKQPD